MCYKRSRKYSLLCRVQNVKLATPKVWAESSGVHQSPRCASLPKLTQMKDYLNRPSVEHENFAKGLTGLTTFMFLFLYRLSLNTSTASDKKRKKKLCRTSVLCCQFYILQIISTQLSSSRTNLHVFFFCYFKTLSSFFKVFKNIP